MTVPISLLNRHTLVAGTNGSGKTTAIAGPLALWNACAFSESLTIATSGVFRQVKEQLFPAIRAHRNRFSGWTFNETDVEAANGSRIYGFSTDEPGRFEGWHNEHLLVIVDEAKSVPDSIFEAIERCQPCRLLLMSSPGGCSGFFYDAFHAKRRFFKQHTATAFQCPHISTAWIAQQIEKYGNDHPLIRSMIHAEFMTTGEDGAVIPLSLVERCLTSPPAFDASGQPQAFCDFAAGGDENCLAVRRGNRVQIEGEPDAAGRARDVLLGLYSGGAHCCFIDQVFSLDPGTMAYVKVEHNFLDAGARIKKLDTHYEFLSADARISEAGFTDFADSGAPIQIWRLINRRFVNVTRQYPKLIKPDAAIWMKAFRRHLRNGVGFIAAWAADEDLLGKSKLVSSTLARLARQHRLRSTLGLPHHSETAFVAELQKALRTLGYT